MFPQYTMMMGSSLLWSVFPLQAKPFEGAADPATYQAPPSSANLRADELVFRQRKLVHDHELRLALRVCGGLQALFEAGDRRVIPFPEMFAEGKKAGCMLPHRALHLHMLHADLETEALAACQQPFEDFGGSY